jgi:hypothetical protein
VHSLSGVVGVTIGVEQHPMRIKAARIRAPTNLFMSKLFPNNKVYFKKRIIYHSTFGKM